MRQSLAERYLRRSGVAPLVRPTRSQAEIDYLPPYGTPEVNIPGEIATYALVGAALTGVAELLRR